jgi:hypothetical protein
MNFDERVAAVAKKGFTGRQARFLTTIMVHSGCLHPAPVRAVLRHRLRRKDEEVLRQSHQPASKVSSGVANVSV